MIGRWAFVVGLVALTLTLAPSKATPDPFSLVLLVGAWWAAEWADKRHAKRDRAELETAIEARVAAQIQQLSAPVSGRDEPVSEDRFQASTDALQGAIELRLDALEANLHELHLDVVGGANVAEKLADVVRALEALEERVGELEPEGYAEAS